MKWLDNAPEKGQRRNVRRFLWKPLQIGGEVRWLETAEWEEEFGYRSQIEARRISERMQRAGERDCIPMRPDPISRTGPQWVPVFWHDTDPADFVPKSRRTVPTDLCKYL